MAAYVIGRVQVRDSSWVAEYGPKTGELVTKHGGKSSPAAARWSGSGSDAELTLVEGV